MASLCLLPSLNPVEKERSFIEIFEEEGIIPLVKGKTDLLNVLGYISFISQVTVESLQAFEKYELRKFDALVGECACQIRAAKIKDLADLYLSSNNWQKEIKNVQEQAQSILKQLPIIRQQIEESIYSGRDFKVIYGISLKASNLCTQWKALQQVTENMRFVIESYLLAQTKELIKKEDCFYQLFDITNTDKLSRFHNSLDGQSNSEKIPFIAKGKIKNLIQMIQRDLASLSIAYLKKEVRLLHPTHVNCFAQEALEKEIRKDELGRLCAPCFYSLESLIQRIIDKAQHILIDISRWTEKGKLVDRFKLLYVGNSKMQALEQASIDKNLPKSVFVIIGNSIRKDQEYLTREGYMKMFNAYSIEDILNANWAQHHQYPGKMDQMLAPLHDKRRNEWSEKAQTIGCSLTNMSLFTVNHILCDRLDKALNNMEFL